MLQLEYIPTAYDLSERAYEVAKAENLIEAYASHGVSVNKEGVTSSWLSLHAYYRKPGQTDNSIEQADSVIVSGKFSDLENAFDRFAEKVASMVQAYTSAA